MADPQRPRQRVVYTPWPVSPSEWVSLAPEPTPEPVEPRPAPLPSIADHPTAFLAHPEAEPVADSEPVDDDPPLFAELQARWLARSRRPDADEGHQL